MADPIRVQTSTGRIYIIDATYFNPDLHVFLGEDIPGALPHAGVPIDGRVQAWNAQWSGAIPYGDGTDFSAMADSSGGLQAAIERAKEFRLPLSISGRLRIDNNLSIDTPVDLTQGTLIPSSGVTVTITAPLTAPAARVFDISQGGVVTFTSDAGMADVYPAWWGVLRDNPADAAANAAAIQQAFVAAVAIQAGTLHFGLGDIYTDALDFTTLNLQPLRFEGSRGAGQHSVVPGTRLIYTGTGSGRFINARGNRSLEFHDIGIHHNNAGFTGTLLDLSGMSVSLGDPRGADGTRHLSRRVLFGSIDAPSVQTALGVDVDGCHTINIEDCGFVGLANGVRGKDVLRRGYANNINIRGGYGAGISGHHVLNLGKSWAIRDYTAEPRTGGVPNLVFATIQGGVPPNLVLDSCECDDGTASGFWVEMENGTCIIVGGDYRIDGGGAVFHALGIMDAISIYSPRVAAGSPVGNSIIDGGGFQHGRADVIVPGVGVNIDTPIRNLPPCAGVRDVGAAQIQTTGTAAPTTDTWPQGAIVWNTAPSAGGNAGWICVTAGTPGTWRTFGTIAT